MSEWIAGAPLGSLPSPPILIRGGRVIDPASSRDETADLHLVGGKIASAKDLPKGEQWQEIDAKGLIVSPGLIDVHVHLREPGGTHKETIASGSRAAAAGGFTTIVAMPNTRPPADGPNTIALVKQRAAETAIVHVLPSGCISVGMKGEALAPIGALHKAGVVAITDDGACIQNNELMRRALEYARMFNLPVMDHCQDYALSAGGVMHEGYWSAVLGLQGWPSAAEESIVNRNALLAELTGATVHCQHLTAAGSVRILRDAKKRGVRLSGEVMPHHLAFTDESVRGYDTVFKVNPPLRTKRDQEALLEGLADGTLEILASDHAPHRDYEKEVEFAEAPFGMIGLETELGVFIKALVDTKVLTWPQLLAKLTLNPAKLLHLSKGTLAAGADADVTLIDPKREWTVDAAQSHSKSRNCPFDRMPLRGRAVCTIVSGRIVWKLDEKK